MEACLWGFYGGSIFELQLRPLMVIFHHGDAAEDKGEEEKVMRVRGRGYFCEDVVVCDVLWNGRIILCALAHITDKSIYVVS